MGRMKLSLKRLNHYFVRLLEGTAMFRRNRSHSANYGNKHGVLAGFHHHFLIVVSLFGEQETSVSV